MLVNLTNIGLLAILLILDYISGVFVAFVKRQVSSAIGRKGIFQKIGVLICVVLCSLVDSANLYNGIDIQPVVVAFFVVNECLSVLENLSKLNVPIPEVFLNKLKTWQDENKNK
ncbi:MAG: phage holin family protein [Syntrophomonadaceae bacterium]|nr:phage holin family protein [Syntrophomonadaceae bacterium]